jgi:hypothetical protein
MKEIAPSAINAKTAIAIRVPLSARLMSGNIMPAEKAPLDQG